MLTDKVMQELMDELKGTLIGRWIHKADRRLGAHGRLGTKLEQRVSSLEQQARELAERKGSKEEEIPHPIRERVRLACGEVRNAVFTRLIVSNIMRIPDAIRGLLRR